MSVRWLQGRRGERRGSVTVGPADRPDPRITIRNPLVLGDRRTNKPTPSWRSTKVTPAGRVAPLKVSAGRGKPAVVTVKEGINLPRYPSVPGRLRARKKEIERSTPAWTTGGLEKIVLRLPKEETTAAQIIGRGPEAAAAVVDLLTKIGVVDG